MSGSGDAPGRATKSYSRADIIELLAPALGRQKAEESVAAASGGLGQAISRDDALQILEQLAQTPGLVGITARFAKARMLLNRA